MSDKLVYECVQSKAEEDEWIVEAIDYGSEGEIYAATFSGPGAEARAREYAAWKNSGGAVLRVWTCCDEEWVIAYSAEDAALVYAETGAEPIEGEEWTPCPDDKLFTYRDEDENGQPRETRKTMREHAAARGRGYFGTASCG